MKKFLFVLCISFFSALSVGQAFAQANVPLCKHDVAPFDIGRYERDMKIPGKIVRTAKVPFGTVWETNMAGGKKIVCRTTQVRTLAILADNSSYDIGCGNEIWIALPPLDVRETVSAGLSTLISSEATPSCKNEGECKKVNWCNANSGWKAGGVDADGRAIRNCVVPGYRDVITEESVLDLKYHLTVNSETLPTTVKDHKGNGNFTVPAAPQAQGQVAGSQGPQVDMGRSQAPVVSGQPCFTNGCSSRPVANFVSEVKSEFCGIRTNDGRFFKLGHDKTNGRVTVTDWTSNEGSGYARMTVGGITGNDCDKVQEVIEKRVWADMTKHFNLSNACTVKQKLVPVSNKITQNM